MDLKILFLGDIVGKPGRLAVQKFLAFYKKEKQIDFVIANAENATHGKGLNRTHYAFLKTTGIDVMTLGNHYQAQAEIKNYIEDTLDLVRPLNLKTSFPGVGSSVYHIQNVSVRVTNILGQAFMQEEVNHPFDSLTTVVQSMQPTDLHIVDFHAEATGEKKAFAYAFDGQVTAVIGTHTHIQTADAQILPLGTAYVTDVGMCGPYESVLGVEKTIIIDRLWHQSKRKHEIATGEEALINGMVMTIGENRRVKHVEMIYHKLLWK